MPAIPIYDLSHPYEWLPFQYSLHVIDKEGAKPKHYGYLAPGDTDSRLEILKRLKELLGDSGTVLVYNKTFENRCLKFGAEAYPEYEGWRKKIEKRIIDLMGPFRSFSYYNPKQEGSYSIKYVLPAMSDLSYDDLEIGEGGTASLEYARVTFGKDIDPKDREKVRKNLEEYCQLDTQAMIEVLEGLKNEAE